MTKLSRATLQSFDKVHKPGYDPTRLKPGIVHFGVGNFHRAHQAVYLDDLFGMGEGMTGRWLAPVYVEATMPCATRSRRKTGLPQLSNRKPIMRGKDYRFYGRLCDHID